MSTNKSDGFEIVSGNPNKQNSMYYFIEDELNSKSIKNIKSKFSRNKDRNAIYLTGIETMSANIIFPGFHLINDKHHEYAPHLTIDEKIECTTSLSSKKFSIAHATLTYTNAENYRIAHVYYNRFGVVIKVQVKEFASNHAGKINRDIFTEVRLSNEDEINIAEQASSFHDLLNEFLNQKINTYKNLYDESFLIETRIAEEIVNGNSTSVDNLRQYLLVILDKLAKYKDGNYDARANFLRELLLSEADNNRTILKSSDSELPEIEPLFIDHKTNQKVKSQKNKKEKIIKQTYTQAAIESLTLKINQISDYLKTLNLRNGDKTYNESYMENWIKLDKIFRENASILFDFDMKKIYRSLKVQTTFNDYFFDKISKLDYQSITTLYHYAEINCNLSNIFVEFFEMLKDDNKLETRGSQEKWARLAEYFFENNEIYRCLANLYFNTSMKTEKNIISLHTYMFVLGKFPIFKIMLKQVDEHSLLHFVDLPNKRNKINLNEAKTILGLMQVLINSFPDFTDGQEKLKSKEECIKELIIDNDESLYFKVLSNQSAVYNSRKFCNDIRVEHININYKIFNALIYVCQSNLDGGSLNKIINTLLPYADYKAILASLSSLIDRASISQRTLFIPGVKTLCCCLHSDFETVTRYIIRLRDQASDTDNLISELNNIGFSLIISQPQSDAKITSEQMNEIFMKLIAALHEKKSELTIAENRDIFQYFAKNYISDSLSDFYAAQISFILLDSNVSMEDVNLMFDVMVHRVFQSLKVRQTESSLTITKLFYESLPENIKTIINTRESYEMLMKILPKDQKASAPSTLGLFGVNRTASCNDITSEDKTKEQLRISNVG